MDRGSVHCLGNGDLIAYGCGPDFLQIFGPPYSAPSFLTLSTLPDSGLEFRSARRSGTAVWDHWLHSETQSESKTGVDVEAPCGSLTDFVDSGIPCLVRRVATKRPIRFSIRVEGKSRLIENSLSFLGDGIRFGWIATAEAGRFIFMDYPFPRELVFQLLFLGDVQVGPVCDADRIDIVCGAGTSEILIVGGSSYPVCIENSEAIIALGTEASMDRTLAWWKDFSRKRHRFLDLESSADPTDRKILKSLDDVAVLLKVQQGRDGGVLAGYPFHLAYVRDQYGVSRCLQALGCLSEAKGILTFYLSVWNRHGRIHNAQGIGVDGVFHVHENDEVEITGYLILQAFDYLDATGDAAFLHTLAPMLSWAWEAQKRNLSGDMLPFNGDETYIAGGLLPRSALNDGSSEATILFLVSGERLLEWWEKAGLPAWMDSESLRTDRRILQSVHDHFKENFLDAEGMRTNQPSRVLRGPLPRFRHGVCEACGAFGWNEADSSRTYRCRDCLAGGRTSMQSHRILHLPSVSLMPFFVGKDSTLCRSLRETLANPLHELSSLLQDSRRPDVKVGYESGLILIAMEALGLPGIEKGMLQVLEDQDRTGAWAEYYIGGTPQGTRCRPWESGINLVALLTARKMMDQQGPHM
jgi:hypothetical protein